MFDDVLRLEPDGNIARWVPFLCRVYGNVPRVQTGLEMEATYAKFRPWTLVVYCPVWRKLVFCPLIMPKFPVFVLFVLGQYFTDGLLHFVMNRCTGCAGCWLCWVLVVLGAGCAGCWVCARQVFNRRDDKHLLGLIVKRRTRNAVYMLGKWDKHFRATSPNVSYRCCAPVEKVFNIFFYIKSY